MDPRPIQRGTKFRSYAEVLKDTRDYFAIQDPARTLLEPRLEISVVSALSERKRLATFTLLKHLESDDEAYRLEPLHRTKQDNFWARDFGLSMSRRSFQMIDTAVWGAINVLFRALKSILEDWCGSREAGVGGNFIPLQGSRKYGCRV